MNCPDRTEAHKGRWLRTLLGRRSEDVSRLRQAPTARRPSDSGRTAWIGSTRPNVTRAQRSRMAKSLKGFLGAFEIACLESSPSGFGSTPTLEAGTADYGGKTLLKSRWNRRRIATWAKATTVWRRHEPILHYAAMVQYGAELRRNVNTMVHRWSRRRENERPEAPDCDLTCAVNCRKASQDTWALIRKRPRLLARPFLLSVRQHAWVSALRCLRGTIYAVLGVDGVLISLIRALRRRLRLRSGDRR